MLEVQGVGRKEETKVGGVLPVLSPGLGLAATIKTSQQVRLTARDIHEIGSLTFPSWVGRSF